MLARWDHHLQELVHVIQVPLMTQMCRFSTNSHIDVYDRNSKKIANIARIGREPSQGGSASRDHPLVSTQYERCVDIQCSEGFPSFFLVADNISSVPTVDVRGARTKGTVVDIFLLCRKVLFPKSHLRERVGNIST